MYSQSGAYMFGVIVVPQLLKTIRSHEVYSSIPVVMMSSHENASTVYSCIHKGADDYLLKPIAPKDVMHLWQHLLRRQASKGGQFSASPNMAGASSSKSKSLVRKAEELQHDEGVSSNIQWFLFETL